MQITAQRVGLYSGLLAFAATQAIPAPAGMLPSAWTVAGLVVWMACWWMTQAMPLTVTALLPFVVLPFAGVMSANETASAYYSPILFLILGGAFIALAIERTGLHRRLALGILRLSGTDGGATRLLLGFMIAAAVLSMLISNTSTALIMMPMALAVLAGGGVPEDDREGLSGALPMGIAFAASIGGLGTIVGSPTNAIAVGLLESTIGVKIGFAQWMTYGLPVVVLAIPVAAWVLAKVQRVSSQPFDIERARAAIDCHATWSTPERRLVPLVAVVFVLWLAQPLLAPMLPRGALTDGGIAIAVAMFLFILPDGTGRPLLNWPEANRAPWDVIMMFGGGLALAEAMGVSGLANWLGQALLPLSSVPLWVVTLALVALVVVVTEFASNVATASATIPVVASLSVALGVDPMLLAMPAALAASLGFMLPAGTGPNAIAWSTGRIHLPRMLKAGFAMDLIGGLIVIGSVWAIAAIG